MIKKWTDQDKQFRFKMRLNEKNNNKKGRWKGKRQMVSKVQNNEFKKEKRRRKGGRIADESV